MTLRSRAMIGALALAVLGSPAWAQTSSGLDAQEKQSDESFGKQGYKPTGWSEGGALKQGGTTSATIRLSPGMSYRVIGMCDNDCEDLDLIVSDSTGSKVDQDIEEDDFPIVSIDPKATGSYTIAVKMVKCSSEPCYYRLRAYAK